MTSPAGPPQGEDRADRAVGDRAVRDRDGHDPDRRDRADRAPDDHSPDDRGPNGPGPAGHESDGSARRDPAELGEALRTGRMPIVPGSLVELVMRSGIGTDDSGAALRDGGPSDPARGTEPASPPSATGAARSVGTTPAGLADGAADHRTGTPAPGGGDAGPGAAADPGTVDPAPAGRRVDAPRPGPGVGPGPAPTPSAATPTGPASGDASSDDDVSAPAAAEEPAPGASAPGPTAPSTTAPSTPTAGTSHPALFTPATSGPATPAPVTSTPASPSPSTASDAPRDATPAQETTPQRTAPLEDADLGDLGDDPLGLGSLTGHTARPETSGTAPGDDSPRTAPGDVVPASISPSPRPVAEPVTGPNAGTDRDPAADDEPSDADRRWPLFGGSRPAPDGPETDVLPGMVFGRVAGRYPSVDPVTSTGRTTMPGRRRPEPSPEPGPPRPPRPTMPSRTGSYPSAERAPRPAARLSAPTDPPLSAPPPAHAPDPDIATRPAPRVGAPDRSVNGTAGHRPTGDPRPAAARDRNDVSATATTNVIPAVTDAPPSPAPRPVAPDEVHAPFDDGYDDRPPTGRPAAPAGRDEDPWEAEYRDAGPGRTARTAAPAAAAAGAGAGTAFVEAELMEAGPGTARHGDPAVDGTGAHAVAEASASDAADAPAAEAEPAKPITPRREAIMSTAPRNGRAVSPGGLAIAIAAILLAVLTIWAIVEPSTPDVSNSGSGRQDVSPAAEALRPGPVQAAASRPEASVRGTVPIPGAPQDVAVSPGGRYSYVAVQDPPRLVTLDAATDAVTAEIPLPGPPRFVRMAPDGARAFVSMSDQDNAVNLLGVVDVVGNRLVSTMPVGADPAGAVPSADGRFVYLASRADATVDEIDPQAGTKTRSVPVSRSPFAVVPSPQGDRLYVANHGSGQLTVVDPDTLGVLATHPVSGDAQAVAASPTAPQVALTGPDTDLVSVVDPGDGREIATVRVGAGPTGVAFAPDGRHLYVAAGDTVRVVDTGNWEETGRVPTAPGPSSIAVSPDGRTAWVTNTRADSVSVLNLA